MKVQHVLLAAAALALSLSASVIAQTRVVDDAPPRGEFRSYWPQPTLEPIVVAQASVPAVKAAPKLASTYKGTWETPNAAGLVHTAPMQFEVLTQNGLTATGTFSSYAQGNFVASACMDRVGAPFVAEFSESDQAWKFVVSPVNASCNQPWKYSFSVAEDGVLKGTRKDPRTGFVTTFSLAPAAGTMTAGIAPK